jgi:hypothetical protein
MGTCWAVHDGCGLIWPIDVGGGNEGESSEDEVVNAMHPEEDGGGWKGMGSNGWSRRTIDGQG